MVNNFVIFTLGVKNIVISIPDNNPLETLKRLKQEKSQLIAEQERLFTTLPFIEYSKIVGNIERAIRERGADICYINHFLLETIC